MIIDPASIQDQMLGSGQQSGEENTQQNQNGIEGVQIPDQVHINVNTPPMEGQPTENAGSEESNPELDEDSSPDAVDYIFDIPKGAIRGVEKAWNSTASLVAGTADFISDVSEKGWDASHWHESDSWATISEDYMPDTKTFVGALTSDISEFAVGMVALGKFKLAGDATKLAKYSLDLAKGFCSDLITFKADTGNVTNTLIEAFPSLEGTIAEYLRNDGTDDGFSNRLKNAIEGVGLSSVADSLMFMFKGVRSVMKHGNNPEAIARDLAEGVDTSRAERELASENESRQLVESEEKPPVERETTAQEPETTAETSSGTGEGKAEPEPKPELDTGTEASDAISVEEPVERDSMGNAKTVLDSIASNKKTWDKVNQSDLLDIVDAASKDSHIFDDLVGDANFRNLVNNSDDSLADLIKCGEKGIAVLKGIHAFNASHYDNFTKETFQQWAKDSINAFKRCDLDGLVKFGEEAINGTKQAMMAAYQLRRIQRGISKSLYDVAQKINAGTAVDADFELFEQLGTYAPHLYKLSRDLGTAQGRALVSRRNTIGFPETDKEAVTEVNSMFDKVFKRQEGDNLKFGKNAEREVDEEMAVDATDSVTTTSSTSSSTTSSGGGKGKGKKSEGQATEETMASSEATDATTSTSVEGEKKPRKPRKPLTDEQKEAIRVAQEQRRLELIDAAKKIVASGCSGDYDRIFKAAKTLGAPTWTQQFNFWFTQQILSGPTTHMYNTLGNALKTGLIVGEKILGGAVSDIGHSFAGKESHETEYALRYAYDILHNLGNASKLALNAVKNDRSGLLTNKGMVSKTKFTDTEGNAMMLNSKASFDRMREVKEASGGTWSPLEEIASKMVSTLGIGGRANARVMLGEDEFFRQLNFQASKNEIISRNLDSMGLKRGTEEYKEAFAKQEKEFFDEYGLVNMRNGDAAEAMRRADSSTFSQDIQSDTIEKLAQMANSSALAKMALPFVRTVYNVAGDSVQHTFILQAMSPEFRRAFTGKMGVEAQNEAIGKFAVSVGLTACAAKLVLDGEIVGALPTNKKEKDAYLRAGIKPYSIKIGDTWVSYQRADPLAGCLGAVANMMTLLCNKDMTEAETRQYMGTIVGSFITSIADKSFLTGFHDMLDAAYSGVESGDKMSRWAGQQLGAMLPMSGFVNQMWKHWLPKVSDDMGDSYYHEDDKSLFAGLRNTGYADILNKIGMEAAGTPLKYDWVTGNPVQRTILSSDAQGNDYVANELVREAKSVYGPPLRSLRGIALTPEQYSRYCELHGTVTIGGKTMMEALDKLMHSKAYDYSRERIADDWDMEGKTYRGNMINMIMKQYRDKATQQLYHDFPELSQSIREKQMTARQNQTAIPVGNRPARTRLDTALSNGSKMIDSLRELPGYNY